MGAPIPPVGRPTGSHSEGCREQCEQAFEEVLQGDASSRRTRRDAHPEDPKDAQARRAQAPPRRPGAGAPFFRVQHSVSCGPSHQPSLEGSRAQCLTDTASLRAALRMTLLFSRTQRASTTRSRCGHRLCSAQAVHKKARHVLPGGVGLVIRMCNQVTCWLATLRK